MSEEPPVSIDFIVADGIQEPGSAAPARPWVGVHFECCGIYRRVYRRADQDAYEGRCPQCGRRVRLRVGPDGVSSRVFRAVPV